MRKEENRRIASLMLVDIASQGHDIRKLAAELVNNYAFGTEISFRATCKRIEQRYKEA